MNWSDATFKASDVIKGAFVIIPLITFFVVMDSKLTMLTEIQMDMRKTQVEFVKDYYIDRESMKNDINALKVEQRLQNLRIEALEKSAK